MAAEPLARQPSDLLQRAALFEKMGGAGHERYLLMSRLNEFIEGLLIQFDDPIVPCADNEQGRRAHLWKIFAGQVGTTPSRDDGRDIRPPSGRNQRCGRASAGPEVANRQMLG